MFGAIFMFVWGDICVFGLIFVCVGVICVCLGDSCMFGVIFDI